MPSQECSKFLAYILRHKPEEIGISLDEFGYADINELISKFPKKFHLSITDLEKLVALDNKKRYIIRDGKIRASQGHSIPVNLELKPLIPETKLFHGTDKRFLDSILKQGLLPRERNYVHLSASVDTAMTVAKRHGQKPVIFELNTNQMLKDGLEFYQSENNVWLTKEVKPEYLIQII